MDDLERIVVGVGPGGFTGIRIGVSTALALGQALGIPVVGGSSIEALALGIAAVAGEDTLVAPVIDARRREVFGALYRVRAGGRLDILAEPAPYDPDQFAREVARLSGREAVAIAGDAVAAYPEALGRSPFEPLPDGARAHRIAAVDLVRRVDAGGARPAMPLYLRLPDAEVNRRRAEASHVSRPAA